MREKEIAESVERLADAIEGKENKGAYNTFGRLVAVVFVYIMSLPSFFWLVDNLEFQRPSLLVVISLIFFLVVVRGRASFE